METLSEVGEKLVQLLSVLPASGCPSVCPVVTLFVVPAKKSTPFVCCPSACLSICHALLLLAPHALKQSSSCPKRFMNLYFLIAAVIPTLGLTQCNFESRNLCYFRQDSRDQMNWIYRSRGTGSTGTGPTNDHTYKTSRGKTLHIVVYHAADKIVGMLLDRSSLHDAVKITTLGIQIHTGCVIKMEAGSKQSKIIADYEHVAIDLSWGFSFCTYFLTV